MWQSGSASCWAEDGTWNNSRWRQNATTTFSVGLIFARITEEGRPGGPASRFWV